jgi:hypothetical protein
VSGISGTDAEAPKDVLAAEEFAMPAPDPALISESTVLPSDPEGDAPKDVLAAEEFAMPAPDPALTPENLNLPSDLVGEQPREVLAAEEFAMPSPEEARVPPSLELPPPFPVGRVVAVNALALVGFLVWKRLFSRRGWTAKLVR